MVKYAQIPYSVNDSAAHRQLALETARKSIVLLKNDGNVLPLRKSLKTLAVIGPNANDVDVLLGNYNGEPSAPVTPLEGIRRKVGTSMKVIYARGSDLAANVPNFEAIPPANLFTSNGTEKKNGLNGEYYASANFDGKLHRPRELTYPSSGKMVGQIPANPKPLFTRVDAQVNFHWWDGAPRPDMNDDDFGVRWTGYLQAPASGVYTIGAIGLNAFELSVDDKPVADLNNIHERSYQYAPVTLAAGKLYKIRLDYHEFAGDADIQLVWSLPPVDHTPEAVAAARQADAVVLVLGLSPRLEGEEMKVSVEGFRGGDRVSLGIPRAQEDLMQAVAATGKPVVLVLMNGSAVAVNWAKDHVPAIVEAWYPGQAGGDALADVLFGDTNPGGRLPVTFYKSADQLPAFTDYSMKGRTYRFFTGEPLYPFGYGLSYTTFAYRNLTAPAQAKAGDTVKVAVDVQNTGTRSGEEVVQLYLKSANGSGPAPVRWLAGFERVVLRAGETKTVNFEVSARQFSAVHADGRRMIQPGIFEISAGGKQPGGLEAATTKVVTGTVQLAGAAKELN
jgi:beta-glucosidase